MKTKFKQSFALKFRPHLGKSLALSLTLAVAALSLARATNLYWGVNGATDGAGGPVASGTWNGVATVWNPDVSGTGTPIATTTSSDDLFFSAGTDATGAYTVTLSGTQFGNSITF